MKPNIKNSEGYIDELPPINYEKLVDDEDMINIYMENQDTHQSDMSLYLAMYDTIMKHEVQSFPAIIQTVNILKKLLVKQYLEARAESANEIMQEEMK